MEEDLLELLTFFSRIFAEQVTKYSFNGTILGKDAFILDYIGKNQDCTQKDLVKTLYLSKSGASRRVNKLINQNFVIRSKREVDNRWENLQLTELGLEVYTDFREHRKGFLNLLTYKLKIDEVKAFYNVLSHFRTTVESSSPKKKMK